MVSVLSARAALRANSKHCAAVITTGDSGSTAGKPTETTPAYHTIPKYYTLRDTANTTTVQDTIITQEHETPKTKRERKANVQNYTFVPVIVDH